MQELETGTLSSIYEEQVLWLLRTESKDEAHSKTEASKPGPSHAAIIRTGAYLDRRIQLGRTLKCRL